MDQNQKLSFHLKARDDLLPGESLAELFERLTGRRPNPEELEDAKWKLAAHRAQRTATWAKIMTTQLISRSNGKQPRWHVVNFIGPKKSECRGIVDLLAMRKNHHNAEAPLKKGDLFEIVLLQVKGGSAAWPTEKDRERLKLVKAQYHATAILLSEWKKGKKPNIYKLIGDDWGKPIDPADVFCPNEKHTAKKETVNRDSSGPAAPPSNSNAARLTNAAATAKLSPAEKAWATRKAAAANGKK